MKTLAPLLIAASALFSAVAASAQIVPLQTKTTIQPSLALTYGIDQNAFVHIFAGTFTPGSWGATNGQLISIVPNQTLFAFLGTNFGGNGVNNFGLPDLSGRAAVGAGTGPGLAPATFASTAGTETVTLTNTQFPASEGGLNQPFSNLQPSLTLNYLVATQGIFPSPTSGNSTVPYIGQVSLYAAEFIPQGWALANGALLPIEDNEALFLIYGTTYGGDGQTTFGLPDLRGRVPIGTGAGVGLTPRSLGEVLGEESTTLTDANIPAVLGGLGQPFTNMQPSLGLNFLISETGMFPALQNQGITSTNQGLLAEVIMYGGNYLPGGWSLADGSMLAITQNLNLFSLLGTTYGGDGNTTYALPDLRGRIVVGAGNPVLPNGLSPYFVGQTEGVETLSLDGNARPQNPPGAVPEPATFAFVGLFGFALLTRQILARRKASHPGE